MRGSVHAAVRSVFVLHAVFLSGDNKVSSWFNQSYFGESLVFCDCCDVALFALFV
jgi:hypothetical protein